MALIIINKTFSGTLGLAGTVNTIQIAPPCNSAIIFNRSGSDLYARIDGIDPTIGGNGSFLVPANGSRMFAFVDNLNPEIRLTSSLLSLAYNVECLN